MASSTVQFVGGPVDGDLRALPDPEQRYVVVATLPPVFVWDTEAEHVEIDVQVIKHTYEREGETMVYRGVE